jgi:hypothetical protein
MKYPDQMLSRTLWIKSYIVKGHGIICAIIIKIREYLRIL